MEISTFCGNIHVPWILSAFHGNINVPWILSFTPWILSAFRVYCPPFVDTIGIGIGHITSYLARNVFHVLHSFFMVVDIIFGHIMSYLYRNVRPISCILLI